MRPGLERPFPRGAAQAAISFENRKRRDRVGGMEIDQRAERFGALPERIERRMIEGLPMGVAVDHGAAELEIAHAAFQFVRRRLGVLHGQMSEARIAFRPLLDLARQEVVGDASVANGRPGVVLGLHAGTCQSKNRAVDVGPIHGVDAHLAKIRKTRERLIAFGLRQIGGRRIPVLDKFGAEEMLFERNLLDHSDSGAASFFWRLMYCMLAVRYTTSVASLAAGSAEEIARDQENSRRETRGEPQ